VEQPGPPTSRRYPCLLRRNCRLRNRFIAASSLPQPGWDPPRIGIRPGSLWDDSFTTTLALSRPWRHHADGVSALCVGLIPVWRYSGPGELMTAASADDDGHPVVGDGVEDAGLATRATRIPMPIQQAKSSGARRRGAETLKMLVDENTPAARSSGPASGRRHNAKRPIRPRASTTRTKGKVNRRNDKLRPSSFSAISLMRTLNSNSFIVL
jgi:hypothetical protein